MVEGIRLSAVDLNLFVAFDALMTELSVTRAAKRVGITQSAMSHALDRLRKTFNDPLLVRTPDGLAPTPRAREIGTHVRHAIAEITRAVADPHTFDPRSLRRTVHVAADDIAELLVVPPLCARLRAIAPEVDLRVRDLQIERVERQLAAGDVELAVGVGGDAVPRALFQQVLLRDELVHVGRAALVDPRDRVSHLRSESPDARVTVDRLSTALLVAAQSDLTLSLPSRLAQQIAAAFSWRTVPSAERHELVVGQFWHERQARDPQHTWLRTTIAEVCAQLGHAPRS